MLPLVPVLRRGIDPVPRELVDEQARRERCELVEALAQRVHVMEHAAGDDGIELPFELLEFAAPEPLPSGALRVDAEDVVAGVGEQRDEPALTAAADLEHAQRRRRQMLEDEGGEVGHESQPCRSGRDHLPFVDFPHGVRDARDPRRSGA